MAGQARKVNWFAIWVSVGVVVALVVVAGLVVFLNNQEKGGDGTGATPTASNIDSSTGAIIVGSGEQTMDTYIDFMCPICNQFEQAYGSAIQGLVDDGTITLGIHPIAILDNKSQGTEYSTRAANAMYCVAVADADAAVPFMQAMYANQPQEGSTGLTDEQILQIASTAGVTGIDDCVNSGRYSEYVTTMTEKTPVQPGAGGIGTPTIAINGQVIANSTLPQPADLASLFTGSSTPSPTATP
jgi:protein-disulfide isomerase